MKKSICIFASMLMLASVVTFLGCNNDNDEPNPSEGPQLHGKAAILAGNYYWLPWHPLSAGMEDCELQINEDATKAVLVSWGEVPFVINLSYDEDDNITFSAEEGHNLWGTLEEIEFSEDGSTVRLKGTGNAGGGRDGDRFDNPYNFTLNKYAKSRKEVIEESYVGKTFTTKPDDGLFSSRAPLSITFTSTNSAVLTHAGECPMTLSVSYEVDYDDSDFFKLKLTCQDDKWTYPNGGLNENWLSQKDRHAYAWYGNGEQCVLSVWYYVIYHPENVEVKYIRITFASKTRPSSGQDDRVEYFY